MLGNDLPTVGAEIKGEIADFLAKLEIVREAIKRFRQDARQSSDLRLATDMSKELDKLAARLKSGIIQKEMKNALEDATGKAADDAGKSAAQRFAVAWKRQMKKETGVLTRGQRGWLPFIGLGLGAAPAALTGLAGILGGLATAGTAAAAGIGAVGISATEVLGPVKQAFTTIDQLNTSFNIRANATALRTWLKSGANSATGGLGGSTLPRNMRFLLNPEANWYSLTRAQRRRVVLTAQTPMTGLPSAEKGQIRALMQERQAYSGLDAAQKKALFSYMKFDQALSKAQKQSQPIVMKLFAQGLQILTPLLKYLHPLAEAAGKSLSFLMAEIARGEKSAGFHAFMQDVIKLAGPTVKGFGQALINIGVGLGHMFVGFAKSGAAVSALHGLVSATQKFANWTGGKGFADFMKQMKADAPVVGQLLKNLLGLLGGIVKAMSGGIGRFYLQGLSDMVGILNRLVSIPGVGHLIYNLIILELLFSRFGSLVRTTALLDLATKALVRLAGLRFGRLIAGLLGLETSGMKVGEVWATVGKAVWNYSKQAVVALGSWVVAGAKWAASVIAQGATALAGWVASLLGIDAATAASSAFIVAATGGIILVVAAIVVGIYELYKHWHTVWGFIKRVAKDAWDFIYNGFGKFLLPMLGPVGILALAAIEFYKHWKTIWSDVKDVIHTVVTIARDLLAAFAKVILTNPGTGILWWAKLVIDGVAKAFGWVPGLGPQLKKAARAVDTFVSDTNKAIDSLKPNHKTVLQFGLGLPPGVSRPKGKGTTVWGPGQRTQGYAGGTGGATPGWAWVGERGPELVYMKGGEEVIPNNRLGGYAGGTGLQIGLSFPPQASFSRLAATLANAARVGLEKGLRALAGGPIPAMRGGVGGWLRSAMRYDRAPSSWFRPMMILIGKESGGNPRAYNPISVGGQHAEGIAQMLPSTFAAYSRGGSIWNPVANLIAAMRYIRARYRSPFNIPGLLSGNYVGYARGTRSARPGWAMVGEHGPELVRHGYWTGTVGAAVAGLRNHGYLVSKSGLPAGYAAAHPTGEPYRDMANLVRRHGYSVGRHVASGGGAGGGGGGGGHMTAEQRTGAAIMRFFARPESVKQIQNEERVLLREIARYFKGPERRWRDEMVRRQVKRLESIDQRLSRANARIRAAKSYQQNVLSGLSGYADLSQLTEGAGYVGTKRQTAGQMVDVQLKQKLGDLRAFASALKRLSAAKAPKALIRQIVALGPGPGTQFANDILAGGPKLMKEIAADEAAIAREEQGISRGAASAVYAGKYNPGKDWLKGLRQDRAAIEKEFKHLGKILGLEAAKWFHVPRRGRPHGYAAGTMSAAPGWSWVGEWGPELMRLTGGERIIPSSAWNAGSASASGMAGAIGTRPFVPSGRRGSPISIQVFTHEINPRYHAAQLGFELARRSG